MPCDQPRQRKRPKTGKNRANSDFAIFWEFSQPRVIGYISSLLHLFRHLRHKFRVPTRHTLKIFFSGFILKMDRKEHNFRHGSSVYFEFLFFFWCSICYLHTIIRPCLIQMLKKNLFHYALYDNQHKFCRDPCANKRPQVVNMCARIYVFVRARLCTEIFLCYESKFKIS